MTRKPTAPSASLQPGRVLSGHGPASRSKGMPNRRETRVHRRREAWNLLLGPTRMESLHRSDGVADESDAPGRPERFFSNQRSCHCSLYEVSAPDPHRSGDIENLEVLECE